MELIRTTLRIKKNLKLAADKIASENNISFQEVINTALSELVIKKGKKKARKIRFITHNLGVPLDNLTRDDYYDDPKTN
jgi:hypothetical protein